MDDKIDTKDVPQQKKGGLNLKFFLIGIPVFIVQLVLVYFVTANILLSKMKADLEKGHKKADTEEVAEGEGEGEEAAKEEEATEEEGESSSKKKLGNFFFTVDDVIVNPAGTNGQRLMLVSVGFNLNTEEQLAKIKEKDVLIKDIVISTLSEKTLPELSQSGSKDSLKVELTKKIKKSMPKVKFNNIYFSKYIIQ